MNTPSEEVKFMVVLDFILVLIISYYLLVVLVSKLI